MKAHDPSEDLTAIIARLSRQPESDVIDTWIEIGYDGNDWK
jgi:hypothetical protein